MDDFPPASAVISAFGGIRPLAAALGVTHSTVQYWSESGSIPEWRRQRLLDLAAAKGISFTDNARAA